MNINKITQLKQANEAAHAACEAEVKGPRGGKRAGAGRPSLGLVRVHVSLRPTDVRFAQVLGDGNISRGMRVALLEQLAAELQ